MRGPGIAAGNSAVTSLDAIRAELHSGLVGFSALEPAWRDLNTREASPSYSTSYDWHNALLRHRLDDPEAVVFVVLLSGTQCVAIVPLQPATSAHWKWRPLRPWSVPIDLHASTYDFPVAAEIVKTFPWFAMWAALARTPRPPRALLVSRNPDESNCAVAVGSSGTRAYAEPGGSSCFFDCRESHEQIASRYSSRLRKSLKRGRNKLAQVAAHQFEEFAEGIALDDALESFLELESSGWKGASGTGSSIALDPRTKAFYQSLFNGTQPRLGAHIRLLSVQGKAIAAQLCLQFGGTRTVLKIAYDEAHAGLSPGQVLMDYTIESACRNPLVECLSLVTGAAWMREWEPKHVRCQEQWLLSNAPASGYAALMRTVSAAKGAVERLVNHG